MHNIYVICVYFELASIITMSLLLIIFIFALFFSLYLFRKCELSVDICSVKLEKNLLGLLTFLFKLIVENTESRYLYLSQLRKRSYMFGANMKTHELYTRYIEIKINLENVISRSMLSNRSAMGTQSSNSFRPK